MKPHGKYQLSNKKEPLKSLRSVESYEYVKYRSAFERFPFECGSLGVWEFSAIRACLLFLPHRTPQIMKKAKPNIGSTEKKIAKVEETASLNSKQEPGKVDSLDDDEQGFGGWLRSADGLETMKLFVIANSIVMLTTLVYPNIQVIFEIVIGMIYGTDNLYD